MSFEGELAPSFDLRCLLPGRPPPDGWGGFCGLLGRIAKLGWTSIGDGGPEVLRDWFGEINSMGTLTSILTDGRDLAVYADRRVEETGVFLAHIIPPHQRLVFGDAD